MTQKFFQNTSSINKFGVQQCIWEHAAVCGGHLPQSEGRLWTFSGG